MKHMKKRLSLLMAAALCVSLAACGTTPETPASEAETTAPAATTAPAEETPAEEEAPAEEAAPAPGAVESVYDEKLTIEFANVTPVEGYDYTSGDPYAQFWADKFNWELEVSAFAWDTWNETIRVWANSGDMPDVSVFQYNRGTQPDAAAWAEQGLVKRLPDDWKTRWPSAAAVFNKTSLGPQTEQAYGGTYFLPRARFDVNLPGDPLPNHQLAYIRKDWAEAVGFEIKDAYKVSELMEYARLVKAQDPGGLGDNLVPMAATPDHALAMFVQHNSTYFDTFYKGDDGTYQWGGASQDTLTGLKLMYQAWSEGLLHPEFFALLNEQDDDMFRIAGTAATIYTDGTATGMQMNMMALFNASLAPLDSREVVHAVPVLGEDGNFHQQDLINYWGTIVFAPDIEDAKFERYMDALDYGCTEEGYRLQTCGFEGVDYEYDANGEMVNLLPEGMPLEGAEGKYPSIGGYMLANLKLWDDFMMDTPVVDAHWREVSRAGYTNKVKYGDHATFVSTDWTVWTYDSPARRQASFVYADEYAGIVANSDSEAALEANWQAWVDEKMAMIQPVLDELNALA
jgi:putative aldouronate transport system substrate-binding protein